MLKSFKKITTLILPILGILLIVPGATVLAQEKTGMGGWELGSPYNKFYKATELDSFKGRVEDIMELVPIPGMSPGIALVVSESKTEKVLVHVAPSWFLSIRRVGLKKGDRVKVRGVWADINGKEVFMASKITKGDDFALKVRLTKDGTPFWTMSSEQLAKERAAN
ncbi:MAG: hypothetical protein P1P89_11675 [Desulfobacterales bacterium]|nr:hypothetical protein [Desulfobacterales bacterium]